MADDSTVVRKIDNGYVISHTRWTSAGCERSERYSPTDPLKGARPKAKAKGSPGGPMAAVAKAAASGQRRGRK